MSTPCDRNTQHWYILCYAGSHANALQKLSSVEGLEYYAPNFFIEHQNTGKHDVWSHRSYCFVLGSQDSIYELKKKALAPFIFMPSPDKSNISHPYVSEYDIEQLRKVEVVNNGVIPLILSTEDVVEGDTVEILTGNFQGSIATAVARSGSRYRQTYLVIRNLFIIPLARLAAEDFRIIGFSRESTPADHFQLTDAEAELLSLAVKDKYDIHPLPSETKAQNRDGLSALIGKCRSINTPPFDTRIRLNIIMALAYMILGGNDSFAHHLNLSDTLARKKTSRSTGLFHSALRYLCTSFPEHYNDYAMRRKEYNRSIPPSMQMLLETAEELWRLQSTRKTQGAPSGLYEGDDDTEHWFCLSAPKKKTEAIRLFRDRNIPLYAPIVSDGRRKDQKNILKDLFFVRLTYGALTAVRDEHPLFTILTQEIEHHRQVLTYSDEAIEIFDYVNSLDLPGKELLHYTPQEELRVLNAQKRKITLEGKTLEGHLMSIRLGNSIQEKVLFLLRGVAAVAVRS